VAAGLAYRFTNLIVHRLNCPGQIGVKPVIHAS
jgi:hypothetical protein